MNSGKTISIIGAPSDFGANIKGASLGPQALRIAGIVTSLNKFGQTVVDYGDLHLQDYPKIQGTDKYKNLSEVIAWNKIVYQAVLDNLTNNKLPLLLGGDHSLAIGSISAVGDYCEKVGKSPVVLWFDSHSDINTIETSNTGNIHGMPLACLLGFGHEQLISIAKNKPVLQPSQVIQVGLRSVDAIEKYLLKSKNIKVYDMRYLDEVGFRKVIREIIDSIGRDQHLHISFDMDFLDPEIAPGVSTAVRGGPTYREAQLCMEMIADSNKVGSIDLFELNPACDSQNKTAKLAIDLLESLFGKSTLERLT